MNVLYLSPAFPPNAYLFCTALARHGVRVLGVGDSPTSDVRPELSRALAEYVWVASLSDYESLYRGAAGVISRYGRLDRVDSNLELWLDTEARLRDDFNLPGPRAAALRHWRSKAGMAEVFAHAGVAHPPTARVTDLRAARAFADAHGFPLVFKPETGAGAARTFAVEGHVALEAAFVEGLENYVMQPFVGADIVTFDGLTDAGGKIVFATAHRYDTGIMQVVSGGLDGHYYSLREIPAGLASAGARAVEAFDVRGRFFHLEFFDTPAGFVALEMNLRPPGGFTTDMMNYACDVDLYDLWARVVAGESLATFCYERTYHVAHAGRRDGRRYALSHDDLVRELGPSLVLHRRMPREFAPIQGDTMYLLRHPALGAVREAIALVQKPA